MPGSFFFAQLPSSFFINTRADEWYDMVVNETHVHYELDKIQTHTHTLRGNKQNKSKLLLSNFSTHFLVSLLYVVLSFVTTTDKPLKNMKWLSDAKVHENFFSWLLVIVWCFVYWSNENVKKGSCRRMRKRTIIASFDVLRWILKIRKAVYEPWRWF